VTKLKKNYKNIDNYVKIHDYSIFFKNKNKKYVKLNKKINTDIRKSIETKINEKFENNEIENIKLKPKYKNIESYLNIIDNYRFNDLIENILNDTDIGKNINISIQEGTIYNNKYDNIGLYSKKNDLEDEIEQEFYNHIDELELKKLINKYSHKYSNIVLDDSKNITYSAENLGKLIYENPILDYNYLKKLNAQQVLNSDYTANGLY
jgi:hypothetical protein